MFCFIVTGFDSFGVSTFNPSEQIALLLPDEIDVPKLGNVPIERHVLRTCCRESWSSLSRLLKKHRNKDVILIMMGVAQGRMRPSLERVALNLRDYRIPDNRGHKPKAVKIEKRGENALFTTVDVDGMKKRLSKKGIQCDVSNHAGTFVCNDVYFKALHYQQQHPNLKAALFIHVPLPKDFAKTIKEQKKKPQLKTLKRSPSLSRRTQQLAAMQEIVEMAMLDCFRNV